MTVLWTTDRFEDTVSYELHKEAGGGVLGYICAHTDLYAYAGFNTGPLLLGGDLAPTKAEERTPRLGGIYVRCDYGM